MKKVVKLTYPQQPAKISGKLSKNLIAYHDPKSPATEAFRSLRTNMGFMDIDDNLKMIVVTSPSPKEGKTSVSTNVAVTVAKANKRVLLIDCDLRKPKVHKSFGLNNDIGLTHILTEMILDGQDLSNMVKCVQGIDNLWVITSGFIPPNPAEILSSRKMEKFLNKVRGEYDLVILDTPPVGSLTDAAILGKRADGVILVIASGETEVDLAVRAKKALTNVGAKILGVVLTKVDEETGGYYYRYKYYDNYYEKSDG